MGMIAPDNKARLEQEIATLIFLISKGREVFFQATGESRSSVIEWFDHWVTKELFVENEELQQLELNLQLLYIKLTSYYEELGLDKDLDLSTRRQAFAHSQTKHIFGPEAKYNFFLHKVTKNFGKVQFIFYEERTDGTYNSTTVDLDLDVDIANFLSTWRPPDSVESPSV